jgi:hypothetical protein
MGHDMAENWPRGVVSHGRRFTADSIVLKRPVSSLVTYVLTPMATIGRSSIFSEID